MKRLETFLTSPGQADPARQPLGSTVCWLENPRPAPFPLQQSSTRPGHLNPVSTRTVCRILSRNGLHGRISAQKPALNKRQLKNNLVAFAKAHSLPKGWTLEKWQKMDFSDESSVELQSPQILQETYWSPHRSENHPENSQVWWRKNHGLGLHPVWGVREIFRVEGNINSLKYQEVLAASYIPNHKRDQILQQDGAPSHTSISTSKFLKAKKIKVLQDWPAQSPDMNIIEHVWGRMKEEAWKMKPKNLDELWEACKTAFFAIPDDFINKLYESLPNRMDAVLSVFIK